MEKRAIILAAGRGTRMEGLTEAIHKCLLEVDGKKLIERQIECFLSQDITKIGIVTGYRKEQLAGYGSHQFYNSHWSSTQMVHSLEQASEWLENFDCLVSYSDIFYDSNAVAQLMNSKNDITVLFDPNWRALWEKRFVDPRDDAESFIISKTGQILDIGRKGVTFDEIQGQFMGLFSFTRDGWQKAQEVRSQNSPEYNKKQDMTALLQQIIRQSDTTVHGLEYQGVWGEVDIPSDLSLYQD
tara:strand:+ start:6474 stop:7196 length:723 start_codon:yes stop_codon:yes gene_type:complete